MANINGTITTNISLSEEDWKALKYLAAEYKTSMAEIIRQGVKVVLAGLSKPKYGSPEWWVKANLEAQKDFTTGEFNKFDSVEKLLDDLHR